MKLTIIIPVYNGSAHIVRCLDSIIRQSWQDFRVLVFDDGSCDDSASVIRDYIQAHPDYVIQLITQQNKGAAETRNAGIDSTDTEYIAFIDQDDFINGDYLRQYIQAIESFDADIVCGGYVRYDAEHQKVLRNVKLTEDSWSKFVVQAPWAHIYRTNFLKANNIRFLKTAIGEDVYFNLMAYAHTGKIITIPDTGYYWVDNPLSHSNKNQKTIKKDIDPFILLDALDHDFPVDNYIDRECLEYFFYRYVIWYLLFTVRHTSRKQFTVQYQRMIEWLRQHYPDFSRNRLISLFGPPGESLSVRFSVWGFNLLYRMRITLPFLKIFACRDD